MSQSGIGACLLNRISRPMGKFFKSMENGPIMAFVSIQVNRLKAALFVTPMGA
jgi:hypothetical protein